MITESVVPLSDLRFVVMECAQCKSKIEFDIEMAVAKNVPNGTATPTRCPVCKVEFDTMAQGAVDQIRIAYRGAAKQSSKISFRVKPSV